MRVWPNGIAQMFAAFCVRYRHAGNNSCLNFPIEKSLDYCYFLTGKMLGENKDLWKLVPLCSCAVSPFI